MGLGGPTLIGVKTTHFLVGIRAALGQLQSTDTMSLNVSFVIQEWTFGGSALNDRYWPIFAVRLNRAPKARIDPQRPFAIDGTNVAFRIAKWTLLTKRSLCAAVAGVIVGYFLCKRAWDRVPHLVAL